jgi:Skp family chaperone for outer membrane proteins
MLILLRKSIFDLFAEYGQKRSVLSWKVSVFLILGCAGISAAFGANATVPEKIAEPLTVKVAYFNFGKIRAGIPEVSNAEAIRINAEAQLRKDVETWNNRLIKMREDKKTAAEIEKTKQEGQTVVRAKQEALAQLVESANLSVRVQVAQAAEAEARARNIDLVVDGQGLYAGGQKVFDHGVDITQAVLKRLLAESEDKQKMSR